MSNSRSSQLKAAWEKARKYAAEHGLSVRKARSILAKQAADQPKAASTPRAKKPISRPVKGAKSTTKADLVAAEAILREKYPHIVAGSIQAHNDGPHKGRRTVEIICQSKRCQNRRRIHSSDAFQVELCPDCTKTHRAQKRAKTGKKGAQ